jgi:hypothetical protein
MRNYYTAQAYKLINIYLSPQGITKVGFGLFKKQLTSLKHRNYENFNPLR